MIRPVAVAPSGGAPAGVFKGAVGVVRHAGTSFLEAVDSGDGPGTGRSNEEAEMRGAFMSRRKVLVTHLEDMTLHEHTEHRNPGACRRR